MLLRELDTFGIFFGNFNYGHYFRDFMIAFLHIKTLLKRNLLLKAKLGAIVNLEKHSLTSTVSNKFINLEKHSLTSTVSK